MFAYCGNNPVMGYDPSGKDVRYLDLINCGGGAGAVSNIAYCVPIVVGIGISLPIIQHAFSSFCDSISIAGSDIFSKSATRAVDKSEEKESPFFDEKYHVHHIVARNDKRAGPAQEILKSAGINRFISPENLVELPAFYHQRIHSDYYYSYVNEVIVTAWDADGADGVHEALLILRCEIESGTLW